MENLGINFVQLTGGEALLHPDFDKIIALFIERSINITVLTSGYYLDGKVLSVFDIYSDFISNVQVSLDGLENIHNLIRQNSHSYERAISFIDHLKNCNINVDVVTSVVNQEKKEIFQLSELLRNKSISRHRLGIIFEMGRSVKNHISSFDKKIVVEHWIKELNDRFVTSNFSIMLQKEEERSTNSKEQCGAGYKLIRIDPKMKIHPCVTIDLPLINFKTC
jgi:MoaA/NifB/PqqE/SkfB family radical SAM enzyme